MDNGRIGELGENEHGFAELRGRLTPAAATKDERSAMSGARLKVLMLSAVEADSESMTDDLD